MTIGLVLVAMLLAYAEYSLRASGAPDAASILVRSNKSIAERLGTVQAVMIPPIIGGLGSSQGKGYARQNLLLIVKGREHTRGLFLRMNRDENGIWLISHCEILGLPFSTRCDS